MSCGLYNHTVRKILILILLFASENPLLVTFPKNNILDSNFKN